MGDWDSVQGVDDAGFAGRPVVGLQGAAESVMTRVPEGEDLAFSGEECEGRLVGVEFDYFGSCVGEVEFFFRLLLRYEGIEGCPEDYFVPVCASRIISKR